MHRLFAPFLAIVLMLAVLTPAPGHAADADTKGIKLQFDANVLQRMSAFVSVFSEVDAQGRWHKIDDASQADPQFCVNFGVRHNWMHNAKAFAVADGHARIDAALVAATIEQYTGLKFASHASVPEAGIDFVDGKYVIAADTPREGPQAVVTNVYATPNNELLMLGHVAGKQAEDGHDDLQVRVAHQQWQGKDGWKLLAWSWAGKPEAKPEAKPVDLPEATPQPVEKPTEQPDAQPAEQPEAQPVEAAPAEQPSEQAVDQPNMEEKALEAIVADEPAEAPEEGQPKEEAAPEAQPVSESIPATPSETDNAPAVEPEGQTDAQPEPQQEPQAEPVTTPETEPAVTPEAQPAPEVIPAPQPEAEPVAEAAPAPTASEAPAPQTIIPFTATTEPDFSDVLAIAVPAGWTHRNAQGVLELSPEAQDAWLVVEAVRLGKRDPQKALQVFSGGAVLTPYGASGASYVFTSEGSTGHREHMIVVDADANLVCRLTWQASEAHREAIAAILQGLRVNGRAVAG